MSASDAWLYSRPFTQARMARSKERSDRYGSISSGVTRNGPSEVAKSFPFTGPMESFISRRWTSRALQSFITQYPAMYPSASTGSRSAPSRPNPAALAGHPAALLEGVEVTDRGRARYRRGQRHGLQREQLVRAGQRALSGIAESFARVAQQVQERRPRREGQDLLSLDDP